MCFHLCGMMLLFNDMMYMLVAYASLSGPICLACVMVTLSSPVEFLIRVISSCCEFINGCL